MASKKVSRALAGALVGVMWAAGASLPLGVPGVALGQAGKDAAKDAPKKVTVIFKDGRKLEGELLSETETTIKLRVVVAGIKGETEYNKSDIKEIKSDESPKPEAKKDEGKKDEKKPEAKPDSKPEQKKDEPKKDDAKPEGKDGDEPGGADLSGLVEEPGLAWGDQKWRISTRAVPSEPNGPKVYMIYMGGEFGRDVAFTPMKDVIRDVKQNQPDVLVCFYDHEFVMRDPEAYGQKGQDFAQDGHAFDQLQAAQSIGTLLVNSINEDSGWSKKPRLVSWVRKAMGGAAFLPFVAPDIYYTPDGLHGGCGELEHLFDGVGDERAREKQYSLRQAWAEGLANLGRHEWRLMRAMSRTDYVLSVKFVDGKPVWLERMPQSPDEILLTDDGKDGNADLLPDIVRGKGNDTLTLNADMALRVGLSNGTAETLDDLMDRMSLPRNYIIVKGKGQQILRDWSRQIGGAEQQIIKLSRQLREVRVKAPGDYPARSRARGERKQILLKLKSIYERYGESLNPRRVNSPEASLQRIEVALQNIEAETLADRPEKR